uniref:Uncharacterized protein n=1 Tax=Oryza rufipogon TaxID=4529 RepID=A0A0G2KBQ9_ORYRU
MGGGHNPWG